MVNYKNLSLWLRPIGKLVVRIKTYFEMGMQIWKVNAN